MRGIRKQARDRLQKKLSQGGLSEEDRRLYTLSQSECLLKQDLKKKNRRIKELEKVLEDTQKARKDIDEMVKIIDNLDSNCKELLELSNMSGIKATTISSIVNYYGNFLREMKKSPEWSTKKD